MTGLNSCGSIEGILNAREKPATGRLLCKMEGDLVITLLLGYQVQ